MPEETLSEDELLRMGGVKAVEAFTLYLSKQEGKKMHLMSSTRYITVRHGNNFITNAGGSLYPEGIDRFIEAELRDDDCVGLVPLTDEAEGVLQTKGLRDFCFGPAPNFGIETQYKFYRR